jgi:hypothetical protein
MHVIPGHVLPNSRLRFDPGYEQFCADRKVDRSYVISKDVNDFSVIPLVRAAAASRVAAIVALVILPPRWGVVRLGMGGSEMSVSGRLEDW